VCVCVWADVNQTEPGDDVAGLKGSNVNHNLPNSEPAAGAADATTVSACYCCYYAPANQHAYTDGKCKTGARVDVAMY